MAETEESYSNHYPPEDNFKIEFCEEVKAAEKRISEGNVLRFDNISDFLGSTELNKCYARLDDKDNFIPIDDI